MRSARTRKDTATKRIWRLCQVVLSATIAIAVPGPGWAESLSVGAKNFTEQYLVAEMTVQLLRSKGFSIDLRAGFTTGGLRDAQERGQVDIAWEYTGTALVELNGVTDRLDADETYARARALDAAKGLVWPRAPASGGRGDHASDAAPARLGDARPVPKLSEKAVSEMLPSYTTSDFSRQSSRRSPL
jgi:hypothetical protein